MAGNEKNDELFKKLITYLQDMYALENQIIEILTRHAHEASQFPQIQAKLKEHLEQTKIHKGRMEARLKAHDKSPSSLKGAMSAMLGSMTGAFGGTRPDILGRNLRDDYTTEHLEIASYCELIATAHLYGDMDTVRAAEENLVDEIATARWMEKHFAEAAILSFRDDGIQIPDGAIPNSQHAIDRALSSAAHGVGIGDLDPSESIANA